MFTMAKERMKISLTDLLWYELHKIPDFIGVQVRNNEDGRFKIRVTFGFGYIEQLYAAGLLIEPQRDVLDFILRDIRTCENAMRKFQKVN